MADDPTLQSTGPNPHDSVRVCKAREILNGMSEHRIDPKRIKTTGTEPLARGGQGAIVLGIMIPLEEVATWKPEQLPTTVLEMKLAIKMLEWDREDIEESTKFFKSFVNELRIMATISHPNIIQFIGFVEDMQKGDAWIVLPFELYGNVREFLQLGEWDIPERISLIQGVINGVNYLHTRQPPICHGDLKAPNILVNSLHHAVITDFGSARIKESTDTTEAGSTSELPRDTANPGIAQLWTSPKIEVNSSTLELTLTGPGYSLRWIAPEVLNNGVQDLPSDMWAVGWICWEILTGKIPFEKLNTQGAIIMQVIKGELPAIREEAQLSHILKLCDLMSDCWISRPAERIDSSGFQQKISFIPSTIPSMDISGGTRSRSVLLLRELGTMFALQSNVAVAESHYQSALDVASRTKNHPAKAGTLDRLGLLYHNQSRYQEAEEAFREALDIYSRTGNEPGAATALFGEIYSRIGNSVGAANVLATIGNELGVAGALDGLAQIYRAQSKYQAAEKAFSGARDICSRIGNKLGAANALTGLGLIYQEQSKYQVAEETLREAHKAHSSINDSIGEANALWGLGQTYWSQSRNQEAERAFKEAHDIYCRIGDDMGMTDRKSVV